MNKIKEIGLLVGIWVLAITCLMYLVGSVVGQVTTCVWPNRC